MERAIIVLGVDRDGKFVPVYVGTSGVEANEAFDSATGENLSRVELYRYPTISKRRKFAAAEKPAEVKPEEKAPKQKLKAPKQPKASKAEQKPAEKKQAEQKPEEKSPEQKAPEGEQKPAEKSPETDDPLA